jgi:hypothetical protein
MTALWYCLDELNFEWLIVAVELGMLFWGKQGGRVFIDVRFSSLLPPPPHTPQLLDEIALCLGRYLFLVSEELDNGMGLDTAEEFRNYVTVHIWSQFSVVWCGL